MRFFQLRTGPRVMASFALVLLILALIVALALWRMHSANALTNFLVHDKLAKQQLSSEWLGAVSLNGARAVAIAKSDSLELADYFEKNLKAGDVQIDILQQTMLAIQPSGTEKRLIAAIDQRHTTYVKLRDEVFGLKAIGRTMDVERLVATQMEPAFNSYAHSIRALLDHQKQQAQTIVTNSDQQYASSRTIVAALGALALALGIALAALLTRSIVTPLHSAVALARKVASGELNQPVSSRRSDEFGQLLNALGDMTRGLARTVVQVRDGIHTIDGASREIVLGNADLSRRTESQAASVEMTTASMEELSLAVQQNATHAREANALAVSAAEFAARGGQDIGNVAATMANIKASSGKMASIIDAMNSITFQTNILALNAAVEAARSGEHGRGFAVVAGEVRTLAQRSANAAKEIKTLIELSFEHVDAGEKFVALAAGTMKQIVSSSSQVSDIVNAITGACADQSNSIAQLNDAVAEIDQTTQSNAALVEEAAAAAESLQQQVLGLTRAIATFSLPDNLADDAELSAALSPLSQTSIFPALEHQGCQRKAANPRLQPQSANATSSDSNGLADSAPRCHPALALAR